MFFYFIFLALPTITAQPFGRDKIPQLAKVGAKTYHRKYLDANPVDNIENQLADNVDVENEPESSWKGPTLWAFHRLNWTDLGTRVVQDAVVREPAPGKITRIVEVQKVKDTIDKSNATKSKGVPTIQGLEEEIQILWVDEATHRLPWHRRYHDGRVFVDHNPHRLQHYVRPRNDIFGQRYLQATRK